MPSEFSPRTTYGTISRNLHWLMAFLILSMFILGWGGEFLPPDFRQPTMSLHKATGIAVLLLAVVRLGWKFIAASPPLPAELTGLSRIAPYFLHALLYIFMISMPLSGWLMVSAMGRQVSFGALGMFPPIIEKNTNIVPVLKDIHGYMAYGFIIMIGLHVAAALYHHFIAKDAILIRMMPKLKLRK